jgi:hypothetical protein
MNSKLKALWVGGLLTLTFFMTKPMLADEWNKRTVFQFSEPVAIPGNVLPAGKYVFELAKSDSKQDVVLVYSEDSNGKERLIATLLTIPEQAQTIPDKPIVQFEEQTSGSPEAIHSWFYPGDQTGWEFIYPNQ